MALCGTVIFPSCANNLPTPCVGEVYFNTTDSALKIYAGPTAVSPGWYEWETEGSEPNPYASGGIEVYNGDGYVCHIFESSCTMTWTGGRCFTAFVLGGGGGGGHSVGSGGGGGRSAHWCAVPGSVDFCKFLILEGQGTCYGLGPSYVGPYNMTITVGGGGAGGTSPSTANNGNTSNIPNLFDYASPFAPTSAVADSGKCGTNGLGTSPGNGGASGCCSTGGGRTPTFYPNGGCGSPLDTPGDCRASGGGGNYGIEGPVSPSNPTCRPCTCLDSCAPWAGGTGSCSACITTPSTGVDLFFGGGGAGTSHFGDRAPNCGLSPTETDASNARRVCVWGGGCGGVGALPNGSNGGNAQGSPYFGGGGGAGSYLGNGGSGSSGVVIVRYCCCSGSNGVS